MEKHDKEYWIKKKEELDKEIGSIESELAHIALCLTSVNCTEKERHYYGCEEPKLQKKHEELLQERNNVEYEICQFKKFDKARFLKNFRLLLNEKNKKIGDIEKEAGVAAGYVSRLESGKIAADPSVEFVLTAANVLGVTVEKLVNGDFSALSPTEEYVSKFLNTLIADTQTDRIAWYKESVFDLSCVGSDYNGDTEHPLFRGTFSGDGRPTGGEYYSRFSSGEEIQVADNFYHANLPMTDQKIYITSVNEDVFGQILHYYEIYLVDGRANVKPVCSDSVCCDRLKKEIAVLYKEIETASSHLHIDDSVRNILNLYMEELPFN